MLEKKLGTQYRKRQCSCNEYLKRTETYIIKISRETKQLFTSCCAALTSKYQQQCFVCQSSDIFSSMIPLCCHVSIKLLHVQLRMIDCLDWVGFGPWDIQRYVPDYDCRYFKYLLVPFIHRIFEKLNESLCALANSTKKCFYLIFRCENLNNIVSYLVSTLPQLRKSLYMQVKRNGPSNLQLKKRHKNSV